eukprot:2854913-Amphidinium_carterae.1
MGAPTMGTQLAMGFARQDCHRIFIVYHFGDRGQKYLVFRRLRSLSPESCFATLAVVYFFKTKRSLVKCDSLVLRFKHLFLEGPVLAACDKAADMLRKRAAPQLTTTSVTSSTKKVKPAAVVS